MALSNWSIALQLLSFFYHLFVGVLFLCNLLGYDVFDQGTTKAGGFRWIIVYVFAFVLDLLETLCVLIAWTRASSDSSKDGVHGLIWWHWMIDVLLGVCLLNHFSSSTTHAVDARLTLQWFGLVIVGFLLYVPLELEMLYRASPAYSSSAAAALTSSASAKSSLFAAAATTGTSNNRLWSEP